jgi:lysophospholipid acyltransferase (LPLAT)-like uncharacterized protein
VTNRTDEVYQFQSLSNYSFSERVTIRVLGWLFYLVINLIGKTLRYELLGSITLDELFNEYKGMIMCGWHDVLFVGSYYLRDRGLVVLTSQSRDAEYAARCAKRFGFGAIRGSSTRGGRAALVELVMMSKTDVPTFFTVDGPRGPRHQAKLGAVQLAMVTGQPIITGVMAPQRYWTINSWDKMQIPKPFSRVAAIWGGPIYVPKGAGADELENKRLELQHLLDDTSRRAKERVDQY